MILYRYVTADVGIQILKNRTIRFSKFNTLHDPLESILNVNYQYGDKPITEKFTNRLNHKPLYDAITAQVGDDLYKQYLATTNEQISKDRFNEKMSNLVEFRVDGKRVTFFEYLANKADEVKPKIIDLFSNNLPGAVADEVAVLCLTQAPDNEQMWAYFAGGHSGVVLGFNGDDPYFAHKVKVRYDDVKKNTDYDMAIPVEEQSLEKLQSVFGVKREGYFFEDEYRVFLSSKNLCKTEFPDDRGYDVLVKDLPVQALTTVIMGYGIVPNNRTEIESTLNQTHYKGVKKKKAIIDISLNKIRIVDSDSFAILF